MQGYLRIYPQTIGTGFTDGKDASRTIRTGFTDRIVVSHNTRELTKGRFIMDESLYKGHLAWLLLIHFLQFDVKPSIFGTLQLILYMFEDIFCWHTYLVKILRLLFFYNRKFGE